MFLNTGGMCQVLHYGISYNAKTCIHVAMKKKINCATTNHS